MKILKTYLYAHLAHLDIAKLADEEIETILKDENIVAIDPIYAHAVGGIKILVNDDDYAKALKVLDANEFNYLKNVFPDETISEQIICKNCGSINVFQKGSWIVGIFFLILAFIPFTTKKSNYICLNCSYKWKE
ncbi:MAG: DUF2007 domain-containing protein [Ignavibacteriales bacterium]|nr:DUF2007 domain-containing protein [Ignavibacteriales bacterium]